MNELRGGQQLKQILRHGHILTGICNPFRLMIPISVKRADTEVSHRVTLHCQRRCNARGVSPTSVYAALHALDSGYTLHLQTSI